jgi:hypothetical protein
MAFDQDSGNRVFLPCSKGSHPVLKKVVLLFSWSVG